MFKMKQFVGITLLLLVNFVFAEYSPDDYKAWVRLVNQTTEDFGNWCNVNDYPDSSLMQCTDSLDVACRDRTLCIANHGFQNCECDNDFIRILDGDTLSKDPKGQVYQKIILELFRVKPCEYVLQRFGSSTDVINVSGVGGRSDFSQKISAEVFKSPVDLDVSMLGLADYGNWCGANNTRSDRNYPTVDGVDEACRHHDLCIRDHGYHECNCDNDFIKRLRKAKASNEHGESYRVAAIVLFQKKPCECRRRRCILRNPINGNCVKYVSYTSGGIGGICIGFMPNSKL